MSRMRCEERVLEIALGSHPSDAFRQDPDQDLAPSFINVNTLQLLFHLCGISHPSESAYHTTIPDHCDISFTMAGSLDAFKLFCSSEKPDRVAASKKALEEYDRKKEQEQKETNDIKQQVAPTTTVESIKAQDGQQKA